VRKAIGEKFPGHNEYELELTCFNAVPFGHDLRHIFLMRMMEMQWADDALIWKIEHEGKRNPWVYRMLRLLCKTRFPVMMGCGSSGKSFVAAAYCYTVWKAQAWRTSVFFSTTSGEAAEQRGWGYIKSFHRADKYKIGQLLEYKKSIVLEEGKISEKSAAAQDRDFTNSIHLVLIKPGAEGDNALAAISGRKNDIVIWLKDESQLMTSDTTGAEANLITNAFCQVIDIGNAPRDGTQFYNTAMPFGQGFESGYKSIDTDNVDGWPTQSGYCEWFDGEKSPSLDYDKSPWRGIISRESIAEIESRCGGKDTPGYWTQVRGFPHSAEIRDTVLTKFLISSNGCDQPVTWASMGMAPRYIGGGDLGFREEGDPCVAHFGRIGACEDSVVRLELEPHTVLVTPSTSSQLPFEDQIALGFIRECDARGCTDFQLDITGDGGIIFGRCQFYAKGRINFIAKSFGGSADKVAIGNGDDRLCDAVFDRMVTQLWYRVRTMAQGGLLRGMSLQSKSTAQLCARKVIQQNKEKKIAVETKREMKKRLKRSPDDADATVNVVDLGCKMGLVVVGGVQAVPVRKDEFEPVKKPAAYHGSGFGKVGYQSGNRNHADRRGAYS
jgi:hypothetical protein